MIAFNYLLSAAGGALVAIGFALLLSSTERLTNAEKFVCCVLFGLGIAVGILLCMANVFRR